MDVEQKTAAKAASSAGKATATSKTMGKASRLRKRAKAISETVFLAPIESAAVASPILAFGTFAFAQGGDLLHILTNPEAALVSIVVSATWALSAKTAMSAIRTENISKTDRAKDQVIGKATADVAERMAEVLVRHDQLDEDLAEVKAMVKAARPEPLTVTNRNVDQAWGPLAAKSVYTIVNPQARFDLRSELKADGTVRLVPDHERIRAIMLSRFAGSTSLARVNIVLFTGPQKKTRGVPPTIAKQLTLFRAIEEIAQKDGVSVSFNNVRFFILDQSLPPRSFFIGQFSRNGVRVPFVNVYSDHAAMYGLPQCLLDENVDTTYLPRVIADHEHLANGLMATVPSLTLGELEERYGQLVERPSMNLSQVRPHEPIAYRGVIDFGDGSFNM